MSFSERLHLRVAVRGDAIRTHSPREHKRFFLLPIELGLCLLLASCAVGPDFERPPVPQVRTYTAEALPAQTLAAPVGGGEAQRFLLEQQLPAQWWELFRSPPLNSLVQQALKSNPDIAAAQAALREAQENARAQQGVFYPSVEANLLASRQKNAVEVLSPTLTSGAAIFSLYTPQLTISYALDPWGGNRRQLESAQAQAEAQRFQLEATYLTLTSNVIVAAIQEASLRAQIAATDEVVHSELEVLAIMHRQFDIGAIAWSDVDAQQTTLAQAEVTLPSLKKQLEQQRDLLARLAGRFPSDEPLERFELDALQLPQELPVDLPSRLVEQRPDVRQAEANLHAATAQVGVAIANMLPQITLTGNAGSTSTQFRQLFTSPTAFWGLTAGVLQPLFDGGTLLHRKRAADAALEQAAAQYRSTVLTAFQNVADALHALQRDAETLTAAARAERAAAESLEIARRTTSLGASSFLGVLNAEQAYQQAAIALAQARANRYADTAALFQALGGGWWHEDSNQDSRPDLG
jgi:NodT family efflux transporter outer membrane factor (OMF) lipoprotein